MLPSSLETDGYYFEHAALVGLEPVHQGSKRFGTLYMKSDVQALYERLRIYSGTAAATISALSNIHGVNMMPSALGMGA
jgi:hypothetical protein